MTEHACLCLNCIAATRKLTSYSFHDISATLKVPEVVTQLTDSTVEMIGCIFWAMSVCLPILTGQTIFNVEKGKSLRRDPEKGVFYAHFKSHQHHRLDVSPIKRTSFWNRQECAQDCTHTKSCFSFNLASRTDLHGKLICELLPSDLYAESDKFGADANFNHFSIKVNAICFCCTELVLVHPVTFARSCIIRMMQNPWNLYYIFPVPNNNINIRLNYILAVSPEVFIILSRKKTFIMSWAILSSWSRP